MTPGRSICPSAKLVEGGPGVRFEYELGGERVPAFVIRFRGEARAYVNRCAHVGVELDWNEGEFFDPSGEMLVCATHGALYAPRDGHCIAGPCKGRGLRRIEVYEEEGEVRLRGQA